MKEWNVLFSQTGSEIYQVSKLLGRFPDRIITNRKIQGDFGKVNTNLLDEFKGTWVVLPKKPTVEQYHHALYSPNHGVTTLHGYLRIIPPEICNYYEIYNGHPGDIETFPELKGFNPQEKAFNLKLPSSGSVIHRVTAGVDEGEIVARNKISIEGKSLNEVYSSLHSNSVELWYNFLKSKL